MDKHITAEQWARFFAPRGKNIDEWLELFNEINSHAAECEECRTILDKAHRLEEAVDEYVHAMDEEETFGEEERYRKVASLGGNAEDECDEADVNSISVFVVKDENGVQLANEMDYFGGAKMYAFNFKNNAYREDCDENMFITVEDGQLKVSMPGAHIVLLDEEDEEVRPAQGGDNYAEFALIENGTYTLGCRF